jgi:GAF domain-containing protein
LTFTSTGARQKLGLDETSFQKLLAAAYVLQQHNDSLRAEDPRLDRLQVFSEIAEIQSLVRAGGMDVKAAASFIADRLRKMTNADGVSISLITDGYLDCVAESGVPARLPGSSLASHSLIATERLKNGEIFECADAQTDIRMDIALCCELGVGSLLAAPISQFGEIAGLIEIRWNRANALQNADLRACRLMANTATSLLERKARTEGQVKTGLAVTAEPVTSTPPGEQSPATHRLALDQRAEFLGEQTAASKAPSKPEQASENLATHCRVCGRPFGADETFCGYCRMPRVSGSQSGLQSKWASLWFMQQAQDALQERNVLRFARTAPKDVQSRPRGDVFEQHDLHTASRMPTVRNARSARPFDSVLDSKIDGVKKDSAALNAYPSLLEDVGALGRAWKTIRLRIRRNAAFVIGAILLVLSLAAWAVWPAQKKSQPGWFDSVMVALGLAEVPHHTPVYAGNPDVRVWVDVHTALYYCEGSDLYGKTPGGRFTSQHDAQQDQFEPASRMACR